MKKYDFFTKDLLEDLYLNQKLSIKNIAEMYNVKEFTIHNLLTKFNINRKQDFRRIDLDEDTLYQLYVIEKKSVSEIKSLLGYCEQTKTWNKLYSYLPAYGNYVWNHKNPPTKKSIIRQLRKWYIPKGYIIYLKK